MHENIKKETASHSMKAATVADPFNQTIITQKPKMYEDIDASQKTRQVLLYFHHRVLKVI